mgnify:CR=1 FL=1
MKYKYRVKSMIVTYKGKDYHPGEIIETDLDLKHPYLEKVTASKKKSNAAVEGDDDDKPGSAESNTKGSGKQNNE